MKIGDIEKGKEYAALDAPNRSYRDTLPRQVKALEIVTVEEKYWAGGGGFYDQQQSTRKVRRVKVKFLDSPSRTGYRYDAIENGKKNTTLVIEARQLIGLWADMRAEVQEKIENKRLSVELDKSYSARLRKLGFDVGYGIGSASLRVDDQDPKRVEIEFSGERVVEKALALMERP